MLLFFLSGHYGLKQKSPSLEVGAGFRAILPCTIVS